MCEKIGNDSRPKKRIKKNNAWVCKVLPTQRIPAESHIRLKSSTMTEALSYGQLFAPDKIDNVFISLIFFESYFGGKMTIKS